MADVLEELLELAEDPLYDENPPDLFYDLVTGRKCSVVFAVMGWEFFRLVRRRISPQEISEYMRKKGAL